MYSRYIYNKIIFLCNVYVFCIALDNNIVYIQLYQQLWKYIMGKDDQWMNWICIRFTRYNTKEFETGREHAGVLEDIEHLP